jgi:uncharacterized paraquat-inducible protein A
MTSAPVFTGTHDTRCYICLDNEGLEARIDCPQCSATVHPVCLGQTRTQQCPYGHELIPGKAAALQREQDMLLALTLLVKLLFCVLAIMLGFTVLLILEKARAPR